MYNKELCIYGYTRMNEEYQNNTKYQQLSALGVMWLAHQSTEGGWNLSDQDISLLLGGTPLQTWYEWKKTAEEEGELDLSEEVMERIFLLIEIQEFTSNKTYFRSKSDFFEKSINHPLFEGKSAKDYLLYNNTINNLCQVKDYFRSKSLN